MTAHLSPDVLGPGGGRIGEKIDRHVRASCTAETFRSALAQDRVARSRGGGRRNVPLDSGAASSGTFARAGQRMRVRRGGAWLDDAAGRANRLRRGVPTRQEAGT